MYSADEALMKNSTWHIMLFLLLQMGLINTCWAQFDEMALPIWSMVNEDRTRTLPGDKRHTLFIPSGYQLRGKTVDVLVDFHSAPTVVHESVRLAGLNCVVISVKYAGLSSVYREPFRKDRQRFAKILQEGLDALRAEEGFPLDVTWGKVAVSSFSAGFGGVREILKSPEYFQRIDAICMADSLYSGYVGDGTGSVEVGKVHPELMKDFLRFARQSSKGEKVMIVTHCSLETTGYASTLETADYLLQELDIVADKVNDLVMLPPGAKSAGRLKLYRRVKRKGFSLYGTLGTSGEDHLAHMRHMGYWLQDLPLAKREVMPERSSTIPSEGTHSNNHREQD